MGRNSNPRSDQATSISAVPGLATADASVVDTKSGCWLLLVCWAARAAEEVAEEGTKACAAGLPQRATMAAADISWNFMILLYYVANNIYVQIVAFTLLISG